MRRECSPTRLKSCINYLFYLVSLSGVLRNFLTIAVIVYATSGTKTSILFSVVLISDLDDVFVT